MSKKVKSDWEFINTNEKYEIEYLCEKYNYRYSYDEIVNLVNEAKEYSGKKSSQNITHEEFYGFMCKKKKDCIK